MRGQGRGGGRNNIEARGCSQDSSLRRERLNLPFGFTYFPSFVQGNGEKEGGGEREIKL